MKNQDNPESKKEGLDHDARHSNGYESQLNEWVNREKASIQLANLIGQLWYDKSIELIIFRRPLVDRRASQILNFHEYARNVVGKPITIHDSLFLATELTKLELPPSWIDIGRLSSEWITEKEDYKNSASDFLKDKLKDLLAVDHDYLKPKDVALFGFGRVGRLIAREIIAQAGKGQQLRLRAIITRSNSDKDIIKRAELLRVDSVHGFFPGTVIEDLENIISKAIKVVKQPVTKSRTGTIMVPTGQPLSETRIDDTNWQRGP